MEDRPAGGFVADTASDGVSETNENMNTNTNTRKKNEYKYSIKRGHMGSRGARGKDIAEKVCGR